MTTPKLPSGPGQTDADHSVSVVQATDSPDVADLDAMKVSEANIDTDLDAVKASLASIDTKIPAKGTAAMAGSTPVTLATNDTLGLTLATGAKQDTIITSLASINSKLHASWSFAFTVALAAKLIVKASPGTLRAISGRIDSSAPAGTYYLQLWNLADVPADAAAVTPAAGALIAPIKFVHNTNLDNVFQLDFPDGLSFSVGAALGLSTTEFTKTAAGAYLSATAGVL